MLSKILYVFASKLDLPSAQERKVVLSFPGIVENDGDNTCEESYLANVQTFPREPETLSWLSRLGG